MTKELFIEKLSDLQSILAYLKDNCEKQESEDVVVKFKETISQDDLLESLKELWNFEIESNKDVTILIKNLSYDLRKEALRLALKTETIKNQIFLMNIFCLIKGYNTFEESYFEHEQVFLNDEIEFLDIFDDLEQEIKTVTLKTAEYYVSMLKTCNLVEAVENNPNAVAMENMYTYLFNACDVTILAKILSSVKNPEIWETKKIVLNSLGYLCSIAEKFVFTNTIMSLIGNSIMERSVKETIDSIKE